MSKLVYSIDPTLRLKELRGAVQSRIMRKALRRALIPVRAAARSLAPVDTGTLKKSLGEKIIQKPTAAKAIIGAKGSYERKGKRPAFYAHLTMRRRGRPANPWLERAFAGAQDAFFRILNEELRTEIAKVLS